MIAQRCQPARLTNQRVHPESLIEATLKMIQNWWSRPCITSIFSLHVHETSFFAINFSKGTGSDVVFIALFWLHSHSSISLTVLMCYRLPRTQQYGILQVYVHCKFIYVTTPRRKNVAGCALSIKWMLSAKLWWLPFAAYLQNTQSTPQSITFFGIPKNFQFPGTKYFQYCTHFTTFSNFWQVTGSQPFSFPLLQLYSRIGNTTFLAAPATLASIQILLYASFTGRANYFPQEYPPQQTFLKPRFHWMSIALSGFSLRPRILGFQLTNSKKVGNGQ